MFQFERKTVVQSIPITFQPHLRRNSDRLTAVVRGADTDTLFVDQIISRGIKRNHYFTVSESPSRAGIAVRIAAIHKLCRFCPCIKEICSLFHQLFCRDQAVLSSQDCFNLSVVEDQQPFSWCVGSIVIEVTRQNVTGDTIQSISGDSQSVIDRIKSSVPQHTGSPIDFYIDLGSTLNTIVCQRVQFFIEKPRYFKYCRHRLKDDLFHFDGFGLPVFSQKIKSIQVICQIAAFKTEAISICFLRLGNFVNSRIHHCKHK